MAKYWIGEFIKEMRERRGYTQEELSFGICSASSLSRIETGMQNPSNQTLDALMERLGMENGMLAEFMSREEAEYYRIKGEVRHAILKQEYGKLESLVSELEKTIDSRIDFEKQYYLYAKGVLLLAKGKKDSLVMEYYMKAIRITLPQFDGEKPLECNLLTFDEITIINAIASMQAKQGKLREAIRLGKWLKDYLEWGVIDMDERRKKYPMIVFNLTNWLSARQRYLDVIDVADSGIEFCIEAGTLYYFPFIIFNKAYALAELGKVKEAKHFFIQAAAIFDSMGKTKQKEKTIAWCYERYRIIIDV